MIDDPKKVFNDIASVLTFIWNTFLNPSNRLVNESIGCSCPNVHPLNSSEWISCIVSLNSEKVLVISVGIPVVPPVGTVNISPLPNPYPSRLISKSTILDPWPTMIFAEALCPAPVVEVEEYNKGILV